MNPPAAGHSALAAPLALSEVRRQGARQFTISQFIILKFASSPVSHYRRRLFWRSCALGSERAWSYPEGPMNRITVLVALALAIAAGVTSALAENWPQWRGPEGTSVSQEKGLPIVWNEQHSLVWKCELPSWGASTPVIWGDAVFLTSHTDDDRLLLLRIDKSTGKIVWQKQVGTGTAKREGPERSEQKFHRLHNLASPSCVTDGEVVAAHFGNGDLAVFDFGGKLLWKRNLQEDHGGYTIWWGRANSPVMHDGLLISVCMQDSLSDLKDSPVESYIVAHDLRDGHVKWKTPRPTQAQAEECDAYTTPLLVQLDGRAQLVVMGGNQLDGYDPASGKQLWYLPGLVGGRTVTSPTASRGVIFATRGMRKPLVAVRPTGQGELGRRAILWDYDQGTPDSCSPVVWGDLLFTVSDDGIARCLNAASGVLQWKERLKGDYKASPIAVDGRIYFLNTTGLCTIVSASNRFDKLTENQLDDETLASPAVSDGRLFIRGKQSLYCIGRQ